MEILQMELKEAVFLPTVYWKFMFWFFVSKSDCCCCYADVLQPF